MAPYLLDTCTFLWILEDVPSLSARARDLFQDPANEIYLSAVSAWEISLKCALGRLSFKEAPERFIPQRREKYGIAFLPLEEAAALSLHRLPNYHKDPFDRMLICQAITHGMVLLSPDPEIQRYPVKTDW